MSEIDVTPQPDESFVDWLWRASQAMDPNDYATVTLGKDRPYNGQPHTDEGIRGSEQVRGLTMRDIKDCFVIGAFRSTGLSVADYPDNIYKIDWNDLDPMAVCQNMLCAIEERMGIFPNLPPELRLSQP